MQILLENNKSWIIPFSPLKAKVPPCRVTGTSNYKRPPADSQALDLILVCQTLPQELIWHGIKPPFFLVMHSLYTLKYCLLQACVEGQSVFTAQPIKEAWLNFSVGMWPWKWCHTSRFMSSNIVNIQCVLAVNCTYSAVIESWMQAALAYVWLELFRWKAWSIITTGTTVIFRTAIQSVVASYLIAFSLSLPHPGLL